MEDMYKEDRGKNWSGTQLYTLKKHDDNGAVVLEMDIVCGDFFSVNHCDVEAVDTLIQILQDPTFKIVCLKKK